MVVLTSWTWFGRGTRNVCAMLLLATLMWPPMTVPSLAVQPDEVLSDTALEARARAISHGLRCLVCQNQSIDDSDAPLARDLRILVRERLVAGYSDEQVREFLVARFGDFVLLKPPMKGSTLLLWIAPLLLLGCGMYLAARAMRPQSSMPPPQLSPDEERALKEFVDGTGKTGKQT